MSHRKIALLVIFLLIVSSLVLAISLTKNYTPSKTSTTPTPTTGFSSSNLYSNDTLGFSMVLPLDWDYKEITPYNSSGQFHVIFDSQKISPEEGKYPLTHNWRNFQIYIRKPYTDQDLAQYNDPEWYSVYQKVISGQKSTMFITIKDNEIGDLPTTTFIFNKGNHGWLINFPNTDFIGNHEPIYEKILNSIVFTNQETPTQKACKVGGCSGELCVDSTSEDTASICLYRADFACYKLTTCEAQPSGACGWTPNPEFNSCLQNPPPLN